MNPDFFYPVPYDIFQLDSFDDERMVSILLEKNSPDGPTDKIDPISGVSVMYHPPAEYLPPQENLPPHSTYNLRIIGKARDIKERNYSHIMHCVENLDTALLKSTIENAQTRIRRSQAVAQHYSLYLRHPLTPQLQSDILAQQEMGNNNNNGGNNDNNTLICTSPRKNNLEVILGVVTKTEDNGLIEIRQLSIDMHKAINYTPGSIPLTPASASFHAPPLYSLILLVCNENKKQTYYCYFAIEQFENKDEPISSPTSSSNNNLNNSKQQQQRYTALQVLLKRWNDDETRLKILNPLLSTSCIDPYQYIVGWARMVDNTLEMQYAEYNLYHKELQAYQQIQRFVNENNILNKKNENLQQEINILNKQKIIKTQHRDSQIEQKFDRTEELNDALLKINKLEQDNKNKDNQIEDKDAIIKHLQDDIAKKDKLLKEKDQQIKQLYEASHGCKCDIM